MNMKFVSKEDGQVLIKGTNPTEMNTFRRIIINKVPTMAIKTVEFTENSSAIYDEMLAHRLGLTTLKTDLKSYNLQKECKCKGEGCAQCTLLLSLEAEGPGTVYADQIKSQDPKVIPVFGKTPLVKLIGNQKVKLEATAVLGEGKEHMKFSPGLVFYKGNPEIKIDSVKNAKAIAESCPKQLYKVDGQKLKMVDNTKCILCKQCEDLSDGAIEVNGSDKDFILTIEPFGQLTPKEMITKASEIIVSQLKELTSEIKKLKWKQIYKKEN